MAGDFAHLRFEPHNGYGTFIDGEPMPFGYISEKGPGRPVFELSPIFAHDTAALSALALKMAAAPDLLEALRLYEVYDAMPSDRGGRNGPRGKAYQAFVDAKNAALAKAEGRP